MLCECEEAHEQIVIGRIRQHVSNAQVLLDLLDQRASDELVNDIMSAIELADARICAARIEQRKMMLTTCELIF